MPKQFITEHDIEDMARRGEMSLQLSDSLVLTDLAYEKAERLGIKLLQPNSQPPAAPLRPYIAAEKTGTPPAKPCCQDVPARADDELRQRIRDAVKAKLGNQIDGGLLETIITRVLNNVGVK